MSVFGSSLLGFLIAVAILVTVHEFGHYLVARWCGVAVERFSIGFGPVILKWMGKRGIFRGTEFAISALPLGGYVRMYDTRNPSAEQGANIPAHEAFDRQPLWKRSSIVAAGPIANFVLAALLYAVALSAPERDLAAQLATPTKQSAAFEAGLRGGERIVSVAGRDVAHWGEVRWQLLVHLFDDELELTVDDAGVERNFVLRRETAALADAGGTSKRLTSWGLAFDQPPILGRVVSGGPAEAAGLRAGDTVKSVNGAPVRQWSDMTALVQKSAGQRMEFTVLRAGSVQDFSVTPKSVDNGGVRIGRIEVAPQSAAELDSRLLVDYQRSPMTAIAEGVRRSVDATWLTVRVLGAMVTGEVSLRQISGPLSMAEGAGATLKQGFTAFVMFLAIVSVSIGVLNLLPVPMLDGGQLLYHLFEAIKGAPLSERVEALGQRIGIGFVTALTALALYNDFLRIFS
ncbi:MAG: RIP metalloprotease RseP [Betaproteobacteria bacterium]|nr:MAG: RIP metalloprotease RseP [Betaproteobacteria bacterium]